MNLFKKKQKPRNYSREFSSYAGLLYAHSNDKHLLKGFEIDITGRQFTLITKSYRRVVRFHREFAWHEWSVEKFYVTDPIVLDAVLSLLESVRQGIFLYEEAKKAELTNEVYEDVITMVNEDLEKLLA